MNSIQDKLLILLRDQGSAPLKYRELGRRIGEKYPQTVKYHIEMLKKKNLIKEQNGFLILNKKDTRDKKFVTLPFYGIANCGPANAFADDKIEGYIKISRNIFPGKNIKNLYLIRAFGNSMNKAEVGSRKENIEDGDFVIVDSTQKTPYEGDYIVTVIDNCANIKKYHYNLNDRRIVLISESSDKYFPILLHESDNFYVVGKIIDVIKNFNQTLS